MGAVRNKEYEQRMRKHWCPVCGCTVRDSYYHSDKVDSYGATNCAYCSCVIDYQDNSPVYNIHEELRGIRSKRKVLKVITDFNESATGVKREMKFTTIPRKELNILKNDPGWTRYESGAGMDDFLIENGYLEDGLGFGEFMTYEKAESAAVRFCLTRLKWN